MCAPYFLQVVVARGDQLVRNAHLSQHVHDLVGRSLRLAQRLRLLVFFLGVSQCCALESKLRPLVEKEMLECLDDLVCFDGLQVWGHLAVPLLVADEAEGREAQFQSDWVDGRLLYHQLLANQGQHIQVLGQEAQRVVKGLEARVSKFDLDRVDGVTDFEDTLSWVDAGDVATALVDGFLLPGAEGVPS